MASRCIAHNKENKHTKIESTRNYNYVGKYVRLYFAI